MSYQNPYQYQYPWGAVTPPPAWQPSQQPAATGQSTWIPQLQQQNAALASDTCAVTTAIAQASRDITDNQNANYRALHDEIVANRMEDKNETIASLRSQVQALNLAQSQANQNSYLIGQLRPTPVPAYTVANPYAGFGYGCCGQQACCC